MLFNLKTKAQNLNKNQMTPSQIAANQQAISNYTYSICDALAVKLDEYSTKVKIVDRAKLKDDEFRLKLLAVFVRIAQDYLSETKENDENFFTEAQFHDIQQHINNLANTNYYIKFN